MYIDLSYSKGQRIKSLNIIVSIIQNRIEHLFLLQSIMLLKVPEMYVDAGWQDLTSLLYYSITLLLLQSVSRAYPSD